MTAVSKGWRDLIKMLDGKAVFKAPKKKRKPPPSALGAQPKGKKAKKAKAAPATARAPAAPKARAPKPNELELISAEFEEDGIDWKVLSVRWSAEHDEVVVWYFDIAAAEADSTSETDMETAIEVGNSYDCLECSSVADIRRWLKKSSS